MCLPSAAQVEQKLRARIAELQEYRSQVCVFVVNFASIAELQEYHSQVCVLHIAELQEYRLQVGRGWSWQQGLW